jgi:hypothetical protein
MVHLIGEHSIQHSPRGIPMTRGFGSKTDYPPLRAADIRAPEQSSDRGRPTLGEHGTGR